MAAAKKPAASKTAQPSAPDSPPASELNRDVPDTKNTSADEHAAIAADVAKTWS